MVVIRIIIVVVVVEVVVVVVVMICDGFIIFQLISSISLSYQHNLITNSVGSRFSGGINISSFLLFGGVLFT